MKFKRGLWKMTLYDRFLAARCRFRSSNIEDLCKGALDYCNTIVDLLQYNKKGEFIKKYDNAYEAGKLNGINHGGIRMACSGLRKTYKGFVWKYV